MQVVEQKMRWFPHVCTTSSHMYATDTRKCATSFPAGGWSRPTFQACGVSHAGHRVATSIGSGSCTRCDSANESHAQPPHHSVAVPMTENPRGTAENGCAMTM